MVRPYLVKSLKKRKREEAEIVDEEEEEEGQEEVGTTAVDDDDDQLAGIPITPLRQSEKPGVIFVLQRASLEVGKVGKTKQLLNSDDHANFLRRQNKDPANYRPDILHQALLAILDSPLNKAGRVEAIYVETESGKLILVNPHVRLPRTFKRFSGIMLQLLEKLSIHASGKGGKLLKLIKKPVTRYLPVNSRKIGFSHSSEKLVNLRDYVTAGSDDVNLVFVVGAMAHGKIDADFIEDFISVSDYPLSAACCIGRICNALEQKWCIL